MKKRTAKLILIPVLCAGVLYGALQGYVALEEKKRADAPGNSEEYNAENLKEHPDSPLAGKNIIFLGSSVTYGAAAEGQSFVELFEKRMRVSEAVAEYKIRQGKPVFDGASPAQGSVIFIQRMPLKPCRRAICRATG